MVPKLHHLLGTKCRPGVITNIDETRFTYIEEMLKCLKYDLYVPKAKSVCVDCRIDRGSSLILHGTYFKKCEKEIREFEKRLQAGNAPVFGSIIDYENMIIQIFIIKLLYFVNLTNEETTVDF